MKNRTRGLLLIGLLAVSGLAMAQIPDVPPGTWWRRPRIQEQLKLSTEQQGRLEEIFAKNRRQFIDLKADVDRRSLDLEELMTRKESDPKKVGAAAEALEQARVRLGKSRTMMVVEMREVLTTEQWKRILEAREQWQRERQDMRRENFREQRRMNRPNGQGQSGQNPRPVPPDEQQPE